MSLPHQNSERSRSSNEVTDLFAAKLLLTRQ